MSAGGSNVAGITERLARFTVETGDFPAASRRIAAQAILDFSAVALAALDEPVAKAARAMVASEAGTPDATALGLKAKVPARAAALVNGTTAHALDFDDTHWDFIGHPTVAVLPAALALAERGDLPGAALVEALLVGGEVCCRLGRVLGESHYTAGFHATATLGTFGATAAACRLLGLPPERTAHALGIAATRASGLKSMFGSMGKPLHAGLAASNGIEAAVLASHGFEARTDAIECAQGFAATHGGACDASALDGLGRDFRFDRVQFKYNACCFGTQAPMEALKKVQVDPGAVRAVTLAVHPRYLAVCDIKRPATGLEAKFSLTFTAAMVLAGRDTAAPGAYSDLACREPALVALRDKVTVETDPSLGEAESRVAVATADGRRLSQRIDLFEQPPLDEQQAKLTRKASALLGPTRADALWSVIADLDRRPAADLAALLR